MLPSFTPTHSQSGNVCARTLSKASAIKASVLYKGITTVTFAIRPRLSCFRGKIDQQVALDRLIMAFNPNNKGLFFMEIIYFKHTPCFDQDEPAIAAVGHRSDSKRRRGKWRPKKVIPHSGLASSVKAQLNKVAFQTYCSRLALSIRDRGHSGGTVYP